MSAGPNTKPCPNYGKPLGNGDTGCQSCGRGLESDSAAMSSPIQEGVAPHRGKRIAKLVAISSLSWLIGWPTLSCSGYFWNGTIQSILPLLGCGLPVVVIGQFCGITAVVFAYQDLLGMKTGRVDRAGWWPTMFGGAAAVFFVLGHWSQIGLHLYHLL